MLKEKISREKFLKIGLSLLAGFLVMPFQKFLKFKYSKQKTSPVEAKYYSNGKNLAG